MQFRHKMQRSFWKRANRLRYGDAFFLTDYLGARFLVRNSNIIGQHIASGVCDIYQLVALIADCERLKPSVFLDIGANSGLYACILLRKNLVPRAVLFEPDRRNAAHLRANLFLNDLDARADLREQAAGSAPGRLRLVPGPEANTGSSYLAAAGEAAGYEVEVARIDDVVALSGVTFAAKIDVEGHELETLAGMARTLSENRGVIQIETWDKRDAVIAALAAHGYRLTGEVPPDLRFEKSR
jgi:FkbM family methyltransferase